MSRPGTAVELRRDIHGIVAQVRCDAPDVAELIGRRLAAFPATFGRPELSIEVAAETPETTPDRPAGGRVVHEGAAGAVVYDEDSDELWLDYGSVGTAWCRPRSGHAHLVVDREAPEWPWVVSRPLLTFSLIELLKRRSLFAIHAAAVARRDEALLVLGPSGSGKSTTALALLLDGWSFLGDDLVFLSREDGRLRVLSFPDDIDASATTIGLLPRLGEPGDWDLLPGGTKRQIAHPLVAPQAASESARPVAAILPRVTENADHALAPIGGDELLLELIPNVMLTDPVSTQVQLDVLSQLAREIKGYRLDLGGRPQTLSKLLAPVVASA